MNELECLVMNICVKRKGYSLAILMVALLVVSIGVAALLPMMTKKKDSTTGISNYIQKCIINNDAQACSAASTGLVNKNGADYNTLQYYLNDSTYHNAALTLAKDACDDGSTDTCRVILDRCYANQTDAGANACTEMFDYIAASGTSSLYEEAEDDFDKGIFPSQIGSILATGSNCPSSNKLCNFLIDCPSNTSNSTCSTIINSCKANITANETDCNYYSVSNSKTYHFNSTTNTNYSYNSSTVIVKTDPNYLYVTTSNTTAKTGYFYTNSTSCSTNENDCQLTGLLDSAGGIKSFSVTKELGASGAVKMLVSFDGRTTWKKCSTCTSGSVAWTTSSLGNIGSQGNTTDEISSALTNYVLPSGTTQFDFAIYLTTGTTSGSFARASNAQVVYLTARPKN